MKEETRKLLKSLALDNGMKRTPIEHARSMVGSPSLGTVHIGITSVYLQVKRFTEIFK